MLVEARDNPDHRRTQPFSNKDQSKADLLLPTALYKQAPLVFTHPFGTRQPVVMIQTNPRVLYRRKPQAARIYMTI